MKIFLSVLSYIYTDAHWQLGADIVYAVLSVRYRFELRGIEGEFGRDALKMVKVYVVVAPITVLPAVTEISCNSPTFRNKYCWSRKRE